MRYSTLFWKETTRKAFTVTIFCCASLILTMFVPLGVFPYEWPIVVFNLLGKITSLGIHSTVHPVRNIPGVSK
jgi:hypothetical protein